MHYILGGNKVAVMASAKDVKKGSVTQAPPPKKSMPTTQTQPLKPKSMNMPGTTAKVAGGSKAEMAVLETQVSEL